MGYKVMLCAFLLLLLLLLLRLMMMLLLPNSATNHGLADAMPKTMR